MEVKTELFELIQNADANDVKHASKEIAKLLKKHDHDTYPALLGVMLKTVAQFLHADPSQDQEYVNTALVSIDQDTVAKIEFEFLDPQDLFAPSSEAIH